MEHIAIGDHRRKIFVCSALLGKARREGNLRKSLWDFLPCSSLDEVIEKLEQDPPDAVAIPFDAFDEESATNLRKVAKRKQNGRPILISYSAFNPDWIENLIEAAGGDLHIRGIPSPVEMVNLLEDYFA